MAIGLAWLLVAQRTDVVPCDCGAVVDDLVEDNVGQFRIHVLKLEDTHPKHRVAIALADGSA